jgi:thioredoxin reductase (NADPH)
MSDKKISKEFGAAAPKVTKTDAIIVGAGPVGLFAVLELGLQGIKAHVVDVLDQPGGQCAELYPDKPIYDIPALPGVTGQELVDKLMAQIAPFDPVFHMGQQAQQLEKTPEGHWRLTTTAGTVLEAPVVIVAAGNGAFVPRKPDIAGIETFEGTSVFYSVKHKDDFKGKNVVISGGGDSALDWVLALEAAGAHVTLVHRSDTFSATPDSVAKMQALALEGRIARRTGTLASLDGKDGQLDSITIAGKDGKREELPCDALLPFYGLSIKLGPIADWGLNLNRNQVAVDTEKYQTSTPGIFAIGDINTYPGKRRIILSGFHESALMAHAAYSIVFPGKKPGNAHSSSKPVPDKPKAP